MTEEFNFERWECRGSSGLFWPILGTELQSVHTLMGAKQLSPWPEVDRLGTFQTANPAQGSRLGHEACFARMADLSEGSHCSARAEVGRFPPRATLS